jgi:hypothetical protein
VAWACVIEVVNLMGIMALDEIVKHTEGGNYLSLCTEAVLQGKEENVPLAFDDAKNSLNAVACLGMLQVEELFQVCRSDEN